MERQYDYPYFGQHPWYAILLQDKFLSCFTDESYYLSTSGSRYDTFTQLRKEFAGIIEGMTLGCALCETTKREEMAETCYKMSPFIGMGFSHYWRTCPADPRYLSKIWHTMDDYDPIIPERLRAVQLVLLIFYPFWHRMGINDEEEFIQSGRLGYYLKLLKTKTTLPKAE